MIRHVLRLTIAEWYKMRRRWMPWILLGFIVLITQVFLWGSYVAYHASDDPFGALIPPYDYNDSEGSIVVTCNDAVEGRAEEKFARITARAGKLAGEERERVAAEAVEWRETCEGYLTPDEARAAFALPSSITTESLTLSFMIIILAATVIGMEYGWGTLRTALTRGVGRWQLLSAKLIMVMVAGIAWMIVVGALAAISSLLAGIIPPAEEGSLIVTEAGAWKDVAIGAGKTVYSLAPFVALPVFLTVVTRSTAQGTSLSMGYYVFELILAPVLGGLASWLAKALDVALLTNNVSEWMSTGVRTEAQQALGTVVEQPDTLRAFFVILVYTGVFGAAAFWLFQRRDVAGAKGE